MVPHHQHAQVVCFETDCDTECATHHHHAPQTNDDDCLSAQLFVDTHLEFIDNDTDFIVPPAETRLSPFANPDEVLTLLRQASHETRRGPPQQAFV